VKDPATFQGRALWLLVLYAAVIIYGSLLPFDLRPPPAQGAWQAFLGIRYFSLGVASRADWIANGLLYLPLGFLGMAWLGQRARRPGALLWRALAAWLAALALALGVEYAQIWFAPRTVSLNDLLAEAIGSAAGIGLWIAGRDWLARQLGRIAAGGPAAIRGLLALYAVAYLALALFPFDLLVSDRELRWRLAGGGWGWLLAPNACGDGLRCGLGLAAEVLATVPFGILLALEGRPRSLRSALTWGGGLGILVEGMQLFIASGVSQGLSVLTRLAGTGLGLWAAAELGHWARRPVPAWVAPAVLLAGLGYLTLVLRVNGWLAAGWQDTAVALAKLKPQMFLPFYYHYFTTEAQAMQSLVAHAGLYLPVGVGYWLWATASRALPRAWVPAALAAALAALAEAGKLFVAGKHPDPTNILIALVAAVLGYVGTRWLARQLAAGPAHGQTAVRPPVLSMGSDTIVPHSGIPMASAPIFPRLPARPRVRLDGKTSMVSDPIDTMVSDPIDLGGGPRWSAGLVVALVPTACLTAGILAFPLARPLLILGLVLYATLLWRRPHAWVAVIPALLPMLDLSDVTGRLWLDAFDLVVLLTLAVGYARLSGLRPRPWPHPLWPLAWVLLWLTWTLATARGLWPLWASDWPPAATSHSPIEAWMVGKGLLWALLLLPLLRRIPVASLDQARRLFLHGVVAGLAAVTLFVLWERQVFVGIADFENVFRVTGPFASMHTGGAYIEAYLGFAFPLLAAWVLTVSRWDLRVIGLVIAALSSYSMLVTFSRGGYGGLLVGLVVVALGAIRSRATSPPLRGVLVGGLVLAATAAAVPVLSGEFAQYRLARASADLSVRQAHWSRALGLMDDDLTSMLTGMGFGRYPATYLFRADTDPPPTTFVVVDDGGDPHLRLGAGEAAYLDQRVAVEPGAVYTLSARVRQPMGPAQVSVALCEKALLYSFACVWHRLDLQATGAGWQSVTVPVDAGRLSAEDNGLGPPLKLSLHHSGSPFPVDIDDVSLRAPSGPELVANGDFGRGVQRWLFVTDQDLAWHIHQQWLETYFAQGALGVLAVITLLTGVAKVLGPAVLAGDLWGTALAGALAAFLAVGMLGSTLDTAQLSMLFYLGAFSVLLLPKGPGTVPRVNA
jgi:VanZ family protein